MYYKHLIILLLPILIFQQCDHPIFCVGQVLQQTQMASIFPDSKTFVDMPLKYPVDQVINNFKKKISIKDFLDQNFLDPQIMLQKGQLLDWKQSPANFDLILNPIWKQFALQLNLKWLSLAKRFSLQKLSAISSCKQNCSTILNQIINKTFIVPGGRFRQCYYWDTFWVIKGLIASGMYDSAQRIIRNFFQIILKYGYIPNGFRIYYLGRSQPPFLALMVSQLTYVYRMNYQSLKAVQLQNDALPILIKQYKFWMNTHSKIINIGNKNYNLNYYNANTTYPRPQSYKQDFNLGQSVEIQKRSQFYQNLASAAESGWDFSSRWFQDKKNLITIRTTQVIPSDLNALIGILQKTIATIASNQGQSSIFLQYTKKYKIRQQYFKSIEIKGFYPDYFNSDDFYASSMFPAYFMGIINKHKFAQDTTPPASYLQTGQQWDFPNVWAPNVWILHQTSNSDESQMIAKKWLTSIYCGWKKYNAIYQKYNANFIGERGQGGQYIVQEGFGWTNGLALDFLIRYGSILTTPICIQIF